MAGGAADILFKAELDSSGAITSLQAIAGETGKAGAAAGGATPQFNALSDAAGKVAAAFAGYVSIQAAVGFLKEATSEAISAAEAQARLGGVLQATGYSAGLTAGQITDFANGLMNLTGTSIATTQSAAAMLATFNVVRGEAFERTLKVANDLAAVWGIDLTSAASALGRAMTIPENAALGLRAAHIKLTEAQADYIKSVTEANGVDAGRAAILDIVEGKVKGVAEQIAAAGGGIKIYAAQWDEAKKSLGNVVLSTGLLQGAVKLLADGLKGVANNFSGITAEERNFDSALSHLTTGELATLVTLMQQTIQQDKDKMAGLDDESSAYLALTQKLEEHERELGAVKVALDAQTSAQEGAAAATKADQDATDAANRVKEQAAADAAWLAGELQHEKQGNLDAADAARQQTAELWALNGAGGAIKATWDGLVTATVNPLIIKMTVDRAKAQADATWLQNYWDDVGQHLGKSFTNVFTSLFEGDGAKAWANMWTDAAKVAGKIMSDELTTTLFGGKNLLTGAQQPGIFGGGGWSSMTSSQQWGAGLMTGGTLLEAYESQQGDRLGAAAGGAAAGAGAGLEAGLGWYAAIPAVIMAVMGYLSASGTKNYLYNIVAGSGPAAQHPGDVGYYFTAGQGGVGFNYGGPDVDTMKDMARQVNDTIETTTVGFRAALTLMGQPLAFPSWSANWLGSTTDASKVISDVLSNLVPRAVLTAFTPYLQTGMTAMGVSGGRQTQELASFDTGTFTTALASFQAWLQAITDMGTVDKLLGQTPDQMKATVDATIRDVWLTGFDTTMTQVKTLTTSLDQMFSSEQVTNAQSLLTLANNQYQAGLQYFTQLESISKSISSSTADVLTGFQEETAKEAGPQALADWYKGQLADLNTSLSGATSADQVQAIMTEILKYGQDLWNLNLSSDSSSPDYAFRQTAEADIIAAEKAAQTMIAGWEQEVADKNALLKDQIDLMTTALEAATGATGAQATAASDAADAVSSLADAAGGASDALNALAAAAAAAGGFASAPSLGRQA